MAIVTTTAPYEMMTRIRMTLLICGFSMTTHRAKVMASALLLQVQGVRMISYSMRWDTVMTVIRWMLRRQL